MTLDEYIIANAGRETGPAFLRQFTDTEVFFALGDSTQGLPEGAATIEAGADLKLQLAKMAQGHLALFFASKTDPRLGKKYAGMPLFRAAEMVSQMKGVDGLLIQSSSNAWFGCLNEVLRGFVDEVGSRN